jgi:hypothetical protein
MTYLANRLRRLGPMLLVLLALGLAAPGCGAITGPKFPDPELEEPDPDDDSDPSQEG